MKFFSDEIIFALGVILGYDNTEQIITALSAPEAYEIEPVWADYLKNATTIKECLAVCRNSPDGSQLKREATEKAFSLTRTLKEYLQVFRESHDGIGKLLMGYKRVLDGVFTITECKEYFFQNDSNSQQAHICIRRLAVILKTGKK